QAQISLREREQRPHPGGALEIESDVATLRLGPLRAGGSLVDDDAGIEIAEDRPRQRETLDGGGGEREALDGQRDRSGGGFRRNQSGQVGLARDAAEKLDSECLLQGQRAQIEV